MRDDHTCQKRAPTHHPQFWPHSRRSRHPQNLALFSQDLKNSPKRRFSGGISCGHPGRYPAGRLGQKLSSHRSERRKIKVFCADVLDPKAQIFERVTEKLEARKFSAWFSFLIFSAGVQGIMHRSVCHPPVLTSNYGDPSGKTHRASSVLNTVAVLDLQRRNSEHRSYLRCLLVKWGSQWVHVVTSRFPFKIPIHGGSGPVEP